jgi:hypothetical protein
MINLNKEEIIRRTKNVPLDLKRAIASDQVINELRGIAKEQNLHVDQLGTLADLVELTLSGVILTREFVSLMRDSLSDLPKEKVLALAEEVNKRIFAPFRESLRKLEANALEQGARESVAVGENITPVAETTTPPAQKPSSPPPKTIEVPTSITPNLGGQSIEATKLDGVTLSSVQTSDVSHQNLDPRLKMIPEDAKARISKDPYKEPLD